MNSVVSKREIGRAVLFHDLSSVGWFFIYKIEEESSS